ncbi:MAG: efflux RND transporter permease subunit, partial [gamma proteobacterium endosymbiont of Lamellibrachia anaximandri]|nr:efflux RND transporter permease subunit [gamma proteobacterium endosymbiont of Lamellibrachia anaximandri]
MNLPAFSIKNHVLTYMLSLVLILFGVISYNRIGVDQLPEIEFPMLSVSTVLPGGDPSIIDASVTNIIESAVNSISGIETIQSSSLAGVSVQVSLRPRERFWDIPVPKIDSAFDSLFVPRPSRS